jgi:transcriptional antiterminator RfaH
VGVETLHPKLRTHRYNQFTGAPIYITPPLFPQYLFAKFNAHNQLSKIWFTRGVHDVVSFGGHPTSVDEEIIEIIRARMDKHGFVRIEDNLKRGDQVVVKAGPLRNLIGIFERELDENQRIVILLKAISYQGHLVVSRDLVQKASE